MDNDLHVHRFKETVVPPTCKESGYTLYTCDCGYEYKTNFRPISGHVFRVSEEKPATCTEPGSVTSVCTTCGGSDVQIKPPLGHDYGPWTVTTKPTCQEPGMQTRKCRRCEATEESIVNPTNHDYSGWVVQSYPTCQEPGRQVRKCRFCDATEEDWINPIGHRAAPNTARYTNGVLTEYFCMNCGQTVFCTPQNVPIKKEAATGYWPTKIIMLLSVVVALLEIVFTLILCMTPGNGVILSWMAYMFPVITVIWSSIFYFTTDRIKRKENYTRWVGVAALMYAVLFAALMVYNIIMQVGSYMPYNGQTDLAWVLSIILGHATASLPRIIFFLVLAIMSFSGTKKKTWLFVVALIYTILAAITTAISAASVLPQYTQMALGWYIPHYIANAISTIFVVAGLTALFTPAKKQKPQIQMEYIR